MTTERYAIQKNGKWYMESIGRNIQVEGESALSEVRLVKTHLLILINCNFNVCLKLSFTLPLTISCLINTCEVVVYEIGDFRR